MMTAGGPWPIMAGSRSSNLGSGRARAEPLATPHEIALAATLLRNAADFYRTVGSEKPELREDFEAQAETCELIADLVESDPGRLLLSERAHRDT